MLSIIQFDKKEKKKKHLRKPVFLKLDKRICLAHPPSFEYFTVSGNHFYINLNFVDFISRIYLLSQQHPGYRDSGAYVNVDDIAIAITNQSLNFTTVAVKPVPSLSTRRKDIMALKSNNC